MQGFYIIWAVVSIASFLISGMMSLMIWYIEEEKPPKVFILIIIASLVVALYTSWKASGGV